MSTKSKAVIAIIIAAVLYGFEWVFVNKLTNVGMPPITISLGIVVFAWFGIAALITIRKENVLPKEKNDLKLLFWLGISFSFVAILFFAALAKGQVASVLVLNYLAPVWTIFLARVFLGESITKNKMFSLGLVIFGLLFIFNIFSIKSVSHTTQFTVANLLAMLAGVFGAGKNVISSKLKHLSEYTRTFWMLSISSVVLLIVNVVYFPHKFSYDWSLILACFLFLGIGIQMICLVLTQYAFKYLESSKIGILLLLEIVAGVVTAWIIGGQVPSPNIIIGGTLIILSCINLKK